MAQSIQLDPIPCAPTLQQRLEAQQRPRGPVVMRQVWNHLLFLHWPTCSQTIQQALPDGLYVDTFEDRAYLGLVPFFMQKVRPRFCPSIPGLSWFLELNLRTYVHDSNGIPGVWFFTLECNQWAAVKIARSLFHLPYNHARMSAKSSYGSMFYRSVRRGDQTEQLFTYPSLLEHPKPAAAGSLEFFLLERYRLFSQARNGNLCAGLVHHSPYQFCPVECSEYSTRLFPLCGFDPPEGPPASCLVAQAVDVEIFPLKKLTHTQATL